MEDANDVPEDVENMWKSLDENSSPRVNLISCVKWLKRGVAEKNPKTIALSKSEIIKMFGSTKKKLKTVTKETTVKKQKTAEKQEEKKIKKEKDISEEENSEGEDEKSLEGEEDNESLEGEDEKESLEGESSEEKEESAEEKEESTEEKEESTEENEESSDEDEFIKPDKKINKDDEFNLGLYDDEKTGNALNIKHFVMAEEDTPNIRNLVDSDSEQEDDYIRPNDNLILVGHVQGDASILEVYVYDSSKDSMYVHHDIILPSFPLCLEWLNFVPGERKKKNMVAIGSMSPIIEIWDLDIINCLESVYHLGQESNGKDIESVGHTDAVLELAWNKNYHHILASGSVDKTVLLWDLEEGTPHTTLNHFKDKVQCLKWHPYESQTLLTGSCDQTVKVFDCRTYDTFQSWNTQGEVERVVWDSLHPYYFMASTSEGYIQSFDCRKGMVWSIQAHDKEVTGLVISSKINGLMMSASTDEDLHIWDYSYTDTPQLITTEMLNIGMIQCMEMCNDAPFVIAAGGDKRNDNFKVVDIRTYPMVEKIFEKRKISKLQKIKRISNSKVKKEMTADDNEEVDDNEDEVTDGSEIEDVKDIVKINGKVADNESSDLEESDSEEDN